TIVVSDWSSDVCSSELLAAELLNSMARVRIEHIPYKGTGPALTDLLGGQVQLMFNSAVSMLPQVRAGKLRGLATTGAKRLSALRSGERRVGEECRVREV